MISIQSVGPKVLDLFPGVQKQQGAHASQFYGNFGVISNFSKILLLVFVGYRKAFTTQQLAVLERLVQIFVFFFIYNSFHNISLLDQRREAQKSCPQQILLLFLCYDRCCVYVML